MPAVLALHGRFKARGLRVSGVSDFDTTEPPESERKGVTDVALAEKMDYPTYLDENSVWSKKHRVAEIPAFLVVNRDGKVVFRHRGKLLVDSPVYLEMAKAIEKSL